MTVGIVSAISSYSNASSVEYQYFGTSISDSELESLMQQYGIQVTGDADTDIRELYEAMYSVAANDVQSSQSSSQVQSNQNSQETEGQNASNVPWANLMTQVGLSATGDLSTDYEAFSGRISAMQSSSATSADMQATINQLMAEANVVFVQQANSSTQTSSSQQSQGAAQTVSGADIVAQLNKLYLVG